MIHKVVPWFRQSEEELSTSTVALLHIGYHGTAWANVADILRHGLHLSDHPTCGTIWLARTILQAACSGGPAVFEVDFEGIEGGWYPDELKVWQAHLFEPIPPSRLRLVNECAACDSRAVTVVYKPGMEFLIVACRECLPRLNRLGWFEE